MEATWARLRKPLEGVAEGLMRSVPESEAQAFATLYERHIETEEALVVPLVDRWLRPEDLHALGRAMALRRGAPLPGQLP
jgi:hemerythrin-like domain-containing protein